MSTTVRRCPICGEPIPEKRGIPAKTCSLPCRDERHRRLERERYYKVKDTEQWKQTRADYIARHRKRLAADPEYAELFRAYARESTRKWKNQVDQDPSRREQMLEYKRQWAVERRAIIMSDSKQYEAHKAKMREWYHSLSPEERERIFYEPRRTRKMRKS